MPPPPPKKRRRRKPYNGKGYRSLPGKWRYKWNIPYKGGHNKERNDKVLTEAKRKRDGKSTQKNYAKRSS